MLGGGGHAKVVVAALRASGLTVGVVLDDDPRLWGTQLLGVTVHGPISALLEHDADGAVIAIGSNQGRAAVAERINANWITVVHPTAWIDPTVRLGPGTVVFAGAVIQPDTALGAHVIVNTCASIDHDSVLEDIVHVAPGVRLAGNVHVERGGFLGTGASIIPGRRVGAGATVGAGAAVIADVPPGATVVGVPARIKR